MRNYCCEDLSLVENYNQAKADNFKGWDIHHRLETHKRNRKTGKIDILRDYGVSSKTLMSFGLYYSRPASELIFMKHADHRSLHNKCLSEEARNKKSEAMKGNKNTLGKHFSEETRKKISEARKGKHWRLINGKREYY